MHFRTLITRSSVALLATALACGGGDDPNEPDPNAVATLVNAVTVEGGGTAVVQTGTAPAASGGPAASVVFGNAVAQGSTGEVIVSSATAFNRVIVSSPGRTGYYEITLPSPTTSTTLRVTYGTTIAGVVTVNYQVVTAAGAVGAPEDAQVTLIDIGTGDVQVNVTWNTQADVDLHVVDPSGEEIYYGNPSAASGGVLDLDGNAACGATDERSENITWNSTPPSGTYIVRLDYWDNCGAASTDYVVTVRRRGQSPQVFTGTFTGEGDAGGEGSGIQITTFSR